MKFEINKRYRHVDDHNTFDIFPIRIVSDNDFGTLMELIYVVKLTNKSMWLPETRTDLVEIKARDYGDWSEIPDKVEDINSCKSEVI